MSVVYLELYPRLGTTYPDADGVPITAAGAIVPQSQYIVDAIRAGFLLTYDPLDVYQPDGPREPVDTGAGTLEVVLADQLSGPALEPGTAGKLAVTSGITTVVDGDSVGTTAGTWIYDAASTATVNNGLVRATSSGVGRWLRQRESNSLNVKWFGARGDGSADDTAAIQSAIEAATPKKSEVFFPAGTYRITSMLKISCNNDPNGPNARDQIRLRGENPMTFGEMGTTLRWDFTAPSSDDGGNRVMMQVVGFDVVFEGLLWYNGVNGDALYRRKICAHGVALGNFSGETFQSTRAISFERCRFVGFRNCVTFDRDNVSAGTIDFIRFTDCTFFGHDKCVWVRGGQPYNINFSRCSFSGLDPTGANRQTYGMGLKHEAFAGGSYVFNNCNLAYMAVAIHQTYACPLLVQGTDSENVKVFYRGYDFTGTGLYTAIFESGRFAYGINDASGKGSMYDSADDIPANFRNYFDCQSGGLEITGCSFNLGYTPDVDFRIRVRGEVALTSKNNLYPNTRPFLRITPLGATGDFFSTSSGTFSFGDMGVQVDPNNSGHLLTPMKNLYGTENPAGRVTISGAATTANVVFDRDESRYRIADLSSVMYYVRCFPISFTGTLTPNSFIAYATAKTNTGFTITVAAAPTGGNSVTIGYEIVLP